MIAADAGAFFDFLAARPEVKGDAFGVCGYCMGGRTSVIVGRAPARPRRRCGLLPRRRPGHRRSEQSAPAGRPDEGDGLRGGAENDGGFTTEHAETLDKALTAAGVEHTVEFYPAAHGFAVPDNPPYDEAAADRHWAALERAVRRRAVLTWTDPELLCHDEPSYATIYAWTTRSAPPNGPRRRRVADQPGTRPQLAAGQRRAVRPIRARRPRPAPTSSSSTSRMRSPPRTRSPPAAT